MIEEKLYSYGVCSKYRGTLLSFVFLLLILILIILLNIDFPKSKGALYSSLGGFLLFLVLHFWWDVKNLKNHKDVLLKDSGLVFYEKDGSEIFIELNSVASLESFPTPENIYDPDYIDNIMSSGIRLVCENGEKYLIFSKVSEYKDLKEKISMMGGQIRFFSYRTFRLN